MGNVRAENVIAPFALKEIVEEIKSLKSRKAPGYDLITSKILNRAPGGRVVMHSSISGFHPGGRGFKSRGGRTINMMKLLKKKTEIQPRRSNEITGTNFGTRIRTRIGQWNVRTLREASKLAQVENEMKRYKISILGLSEIRWKENGEIMTNEGNQFIYSGNSRGEYGVGFIISKQMSKSVISWEPISNRLITLRLNSRIRKVSIIQCYAPTEVADESEKNELYEQLTAAIYKVPRTDILILMGDFNAKVGQRDPEDECTATGTHGLGVLNNNGERLRDFCREHNLVIGGTLFPHKNIHKYTWTSPDGITKNQIDHICISKKWRSSLMDVRTMRGADAQTDHMLLTCEVRLKLSALARNSTRKRKCLNTKELKSEAKRFELSQKIEDLIVTESPITEEGIQRIYRRAGEEVIGTINPERKWWISDDTWELINKRRTLRRKLLTDTNNNAVREQHKTICKEVKRAARNDKRRYHNNIAAEAQVAAEQHDTKQLYKKIRLLSNRGLNKEHPIRDKNGNILTETQRQIERWVEYFNEASNTQLPEFQPEIWASRNEERCNINTSPPSSREICEAIAQLKNNRAEGTDGIRAELMKADPLQCARALQPIIGRIWETENICKEWKRGIIVKLPKKGDLTNCSNWRGITLLNAVIKILAIILHSRIKDHIEKRLRKEQNSTRHSIWHSWTSRQLSTP
ncbi:uncharacterized protein LOC129616594 [Condylostylus longicornis]|uniref:uncharacterized protein LOC129616594 n=1 Tax=Condylostylus longicornis TaxID=2530218 RepID=UPI00244E2907|nr:uncharacterized protein LOC129616594 [Condylostylus longicornis]